MTTTTNPGRLRERVKGGELTPKEALEFLAAREAEGHYVNARIVRWLKRRAK